MEPLAVYSVSNNHMIFIYEISHDMRTGIDMALVGNEVISADWCEIDYENDLDGETLIINYGEMKIPLNDFFIINNI